MAVYSICVTMITWNYTKGRLSHRRHDLKILDVVLVIVADDIVYALVCDCALVICLRHVRDVWLILMSSARNQLRHLQKKLLRADICKEARG